MKQLPHSSHKANVVAYSAAVSACEKCKHWEYALILFYEALKTLKLNVVFGLFCLLLFLWCFGVLLCDRDGFQAQEWSAAGRGGSKLSYTPTGPGAPVNGGRWTSYFLLSRNYPCLRLIVRCCLRGKR